MLTQYCWPRVVPSLHFRRTARRFPVGGPIYVRSTECACRLSSLSDSLIKSLRSDEIKEGTYASSLLLWSFIQTLSGNNNAIRTAVGWTFPNGVTNPLSDPVVFADLHLFAARWALNDGNLEAARDNVDKAIASTLSLTFEHYDAPRLIVRSALLLLESYDTERALRLLVQAEPLLLRIPENSLLGCEYLEVRGLLLATIGDFNSAARDFQAAIEKLERQQARTRTKSFFMAALYNDLLGVQAIRGDVEAIKRLLQTHPLAASKPEKQSGVGYFADRQRVSRFQSPRNSHACLSATSRTRDGATSSFIHRGGRAYQRGFREVSDFRLGRFRGCAQERVKSQSIRYFWSASARKLA